METNTNTYCIVLEIILVEKFEFFTTFQFFKAVFEEIDFLLNKPAPQIFPATSMEKMLAAL